MKYDFPGLKKLGARGLEMAIASSPVGAQLLTLPVVGPFTRGLIEYFANWLTNEGLIVLNLGAIAVEGEWDQHAFDKAMDEALKKIQDHTGELTPEQMREIDNAVILAARKFIVIGRGY